MFRKLDPQLSDAEVFDLIKTSMDAIFPLPPDGIGIKKGKEETYDRILEIEILLEATFEAFHDLLREILRKDLSPNGIDSIFKVNNYTYRLYLQGMPSVWIEY